MPSRVENVLPAPRTHRAEPGCGHGCGKRRAPRSRPANALRAGPKARHLGGQLGLAVG
jgi:hypothetical protein